MPPQTSKTAPSQHELDQKRGLSGVEVDPTPNENYTVKGVGEGKPTPETDPDAAAAARDALGR